MGLPTVDLDRVELMRAGGPYHGYGSPPEGDHITPDDLAGYAKATNELLADVEPVNKIGHDPEQRFARASGLFGDDDQTPALGFLQNFRVEGDSLYADVKKVPRR